MKKITSFQYDDIAIPVRVYFELRMDVRIAILADKVSLRMPSFYTGKQKEKTIEWAKKWVQNRIEKSPQLREKFKVKNYKTGDILHINGKNFKLVINKKYTNTYTASLKDDTIYISVPVGDEGLSRQKALKTLQSRLMAKYFLYEITIRILEINDKYFKNNINRIRLKYNKSNWGSRSANNNINISTRLLFAPKDVQDYVFVHELAHFKEMNHSPSFWNIVKKVIPDYKEKEKWLKTNGHLCDF